MDITNIVCPNCKKNFTDLKGQPGQTLPCPICWELITLLALRTTNHETCDNSSQANSILQSSVIPPPTQEKNSATEENVCAQCRIAFQTWNFFGDNKRVVFAGMHFHRRCARVFEAEDRKRKTIETLSAAKQLEFFALSGSCLMPYESHFPPSGGKWPYYVGMIAFTNLGIIFSAFCQAGNKSSSVSNSMTGGGVLKGGLSGGLAGGLIGSVFDTVIEAKLIKSIQKAIDGSLNVKQFWDQIGESVDDFLVPVSEIKSIEWKTGLNHFGGTIYVKTAEKKRAFLLDKLNIAKIEEGMNRFLREGVNGNRT